jgi:hypothetical protein
MVAKQDNTSHFKAESKIRPTEVNKIKAEITVSRFDFNPRSFATFCFQP